MRNLYVPYFLGMIVMYFSFFIAEYFFSHIFSTAQKFHLIGGATIVACVIIYLVNSVGGEKCLE